MGTVRNILEKKGNAVYSVSPDSSVYDALEMLEDRNLGCLVVVDKGNLIGIFTERDYARKVILLGRSLDGVGPAVIIFEADSPEAATAFVGSDPFVAEGVMRAELHPFHAMFVRGER